MYQVRVTFNDFETVQFDTEDICISNTTIRIDGVSSRLDAFDDYMLCTRIEEMARCKIFKDGVPYAKGVLAGIHADDAWNIDSIIIRVKERYDYGN